MINALKPWDVPNLISPEEAIENIKEYMRDKQREAEEEKANPKPVIVPLVQPVITGSLEEPSKGLVAGFLNDKGIFEEIKDLAVAKYKSAKPLMLPVYNDKVVQGSNPFYAVLVNEVLRLDSTQRLWTASQADMERTLRAGDILKIEGNYYVDTALVLRSPEDPYEPNNPIAKDLSKQVKERLEKDMKLPVMIPLHSLDLKLDPNNEYGLGFNLREDAQLIYAPVLNKKGNFSSVNPETGLPVEVGSQGSRRLYTRQGGLYRLYLSGDLGLNSGWNNLGGSYEAGRVVVCGEAVQKNLEESLLETRTKELENARDKIIVSVNKRYEKALKYLQGKE